MPLSTQATDDYPTSDGRPVAETDWHRVLMSELIKTLEAWYADLPDAYVSGNLLLHYVEGDGRRHVAPDVFVCFGVGKQARGNYLVWEEGPPAIVIELTSKTTHQEDTDHKMALYRDVIGVAEYILFDPREEYLDPSLQGYHLVNGEYQPMPVQEGRLFSQSLGLWLERDGGSLCFVDPNTEERLRLPEVAERERAEAAEEALDSVAEERDVIAEERDVALEERDVALEERDVLADRNTTLRQERDRIAEERDAIASERDAAVAAMRAAQEELAEMRRQMGKPSP